MLHGDQQVILGATRLALRHLEYFLSRPEVDEEPAAVFAQVVRELLAKADLAAWQCDTIGWWCLRRWERLRHRVRPPPETMEDFVQSRVRACEHEALMGIVEANTRAFEAARRTA